MSKEIELSRRENGLTIRFLAQPIFNDSLFPDQVGIKTLLSYAKNGNGNRISSNPDIRFEYFFLFHLNDFESGDKSEIDLLIRNGETLYMVEVKGFTNPNDTNVKREIIRNYLKLKELTLDNITNSAKFDKVSEIIPVLLYSIPQALKNNKANEFNYFNENYLIYQGYRQKEKISIWDSSSIKLSLQKNFSPSAVEEINRKLFFLTWDDVYDSLKELNGDGKFVHVLNELRNKKDNFQGNTPLISN